MDKSGSQKLEAHQAYGVPPWLTNHVGDACCQGRDRSGLISGSRLIFNSYSKLTQSILNFSLTKSHFFCYNCFQRKDTSNSCFFVVINIISEVFPFSYLLSHMYYLISSLKILQSHFSMLYLVWYPSFSAGLSLFG